MKTLEFLVALTVLLSFSCSNDDDSGTPSNSELIIGKWQLTSSTVDGMPVALSDCLLQTTIEFKANGELSLAGFAEVSVVGQDTSECNASAAITLNYTIDGNIITVGSGAEADKTTIVTLNATTLTVSYTDEDNDGGEVITVVNTDTFTRI